ncbi:MAG TPA: ankyrin repeat domain-containing protein [Burkholderiaceae bacterium]|nr:ankyrin repeat domain-containing protein [Burkholderiaceae bacterium]
MKTKAPRAILPPLKSTTRSCGTWTTPLGSQIRLFVGLKDGSMRTTIGATQAGGTYTEARVQAWNATSDNALFQPLAIAEAERRLGIYEENSPNARSVLNELSQALARNNQAYSAADKARAAFLIAKHLSPKMTVSYRNSPYNNHQFASLAFELALLSVRQKDLLTSVDYDALRSCAKLLLSVSTKSAVFEFAPVHLRITYSELEAKKKAFTQLKQSRHELERDENFFYRDADDFNLRRRGEWSENQNVHWRPVAGHAQVVFGRVRECISRPTCSASNARAELTQWLEQQRRQTAKSSPMHDVYQRALACLFHYPHGTDGHGAHIDALLPTLWTYLTTQSVDTAQQNAFKEAICGVLAEQVRLMSCASGFKTRLKECFATIDDRLNQLADSFRFNAEHDRLATAIAANLHAQMSKERAGHDAQAVVDRYIDMLHARLWFELCAGHGVALSELNPHALRLAQGFTVADLNDESDVVTIAPSPARFSGREIIHALTATRSSAPVASTLLDEHDRALTIEEAITQGVSRRVLELVTNKPKLAKMANAGGFEPLHLAARYNQREIASILITAGAKVNACTRGTDRTPLHIAAEHGSLDTLRVLLEHKANPKAKDRDGNTALLVAARNNRANTLTELLEVRLKDLNRANKGGETPLHLAARTGSIDVMRVLLAHNADLDAHDRSHSTPLFSAVYANQAGAVDELLKARKSDVNNVNRELETPLYYAARQGMSGIARTLLAHDADTDLRDRDNNAPIHIASELGRVDVIAELLRARPTDVNKAGQYGCTPLHIATRHGKEDVMRLLLAHNADTDARDERGNAPIHLAIRHYRRDAFPLLIEGRESDVHKINHKGRTPLHVAARHGSSFFIEMLLIYGANPHARDHDRQTPLDLARANKQFRVVQTLNYYLANRAQPSTSRIRSPRA